MNRRLIVVDDDASVRRAILRWARVSGYEATSFDCARMFLATAIPPGACLILDVGLPDLDGAEVKRQLIADGRDLPTVFISALGEEELAQALAGVEAPRVLRKPFEVAALAAALAQMR